MEEPEEQEPGPELEPEDLNAAEEADIGDNGGLTQAGDESCAVDVTAGDPEGAATETVSAPEKTEEEEIAASERDGAEAGPDSEERAVSEVENQVEEPVIQAEEDSRQTTADLQPDLQMDSEENLELLRELRAEHEHLSRLSYQLQKQLPDHWGTVKPEEDLQWNQECCPEYPDILEDVKKLLEERRQKRLHQRHVDDLLQQRNQKLEQLALEWSMLISSQREVLITDLEQVKGRTEARAVTERLLSAAQKCEDQFASVRRENLRLNRKMHSLGSELRAREEFLDGEMNHMDYEQLIIENQTFSEKIQECKEDLLKLKRMLPHTAQILLHVKEKLHFIQEEHQKMQLRFDKLDASVLHEQQTLTQTMQTRDKLRFDNLRIRQDSGLLGRPALLRDLEDTEDKREELERQVEVLQRS